jgi:mRNA interferase MazF
VVRRGQIWTVLRGGGQHRVLVVSNDEYNAREELAAWGLGVLRDLPQPNDLVVRLRRGDPLDGAYVKIYNVVQIFDRTALRDNHGFVSNATMSSVDHALKTFLALN